MRLDYVHKIRTPSLVQPLNTIGRLSYHFFFKKIMKILIQPLIIVTSQLQFLDTKNEI